MDAAEILECMLARYEQCQSYLGSGYVEGGYDNQVQFKTSFKRPGLFRCEWTHCTPDGEQSHSGAVWSDGKDHFISGGKDGTERRESFRSAIATVTGVSAGTAHVNATLLMPEAGVGGRTLQSLQPYETLSDAKLDNSDCFVLKAEWREGCSKELWIEQSQFYLLKLVSQSTPTEAQRQGWLEAVKLRSPDYFDKFEKFLKENPNRTRTSEMIYSIQQFNVELGNEIFSTGSA